MSLVRFALLLVLVSLSACDEPGGAAVPAAPRPEPIVVYASNADETYLPELFAEFTRQTGTRVTVKHADAASNVAALVKQRGSPPADLLLTPTAVGVWRAADEGALRPLGSEYLQQNVAPGFRDPDHYWTAVSVRAAQIVVDRRRLATADLTRYEDLAEPRYKGLLCLSASALAVNRSIIAMLIRTHRRRPAEIIVRGWVANLALPPFAAEAELVAAVEAGTCAVGFVSANEPRLASLLESDARFEVLTPVLAARSVEAAGINRHAREPEAALVLLEWLLSADVQARHSRATGSRPVIRIAGSGDSQSLAADNAVTAPSFDADALGLAERARYR